MSEVPLKDRIIAHTVWGLHDLQRKGLIWIENGQLPPLTENQQLIVRMDLANKQAPSKKQVTACILHLEGLFNFKVHSKKVTGFG
jgi:hypothetical protein